MKLYTCGFITRLNKPGLYGEPNLRFLGFFLKALFYIYNKHHEAAVH